MKLFDVLTTCLGSGKHQRTLSAMVVFRVGERMFLSIVERVEDDWAAWNGTRLWEQPERNESGRVGVFLRTYMWKVDLRLDDAEKQSRTDCRRALARSEGEKKGSQTYRVRQGGVGRTAEGLKVEKKA